MHMGTHLYLHCVYVVFCRIIPRYLQGIIMHSRYFLYFGMSIHYNSMYINSPQSHSHSLSQIDPFVNIKTENRSQLATLNIGI